MSLDIEYVSISSRAMIVSVVSIATTIFVLIPLYILVYRVSPLAFLAIVIALIGLDLGVAAWTLMVKRNERRIKQYIPRILSGIEGRTIRFNTSINTEIGLFWTAGKWVSTGRSRYYSSKSRFNGIRQITGTVVEIPEEIWNQYTIVINIDGFGTVELPAIKIMEPELRDTVILIIPAPIRYMEQDYNLAVYHDAGDHATANLRLHGNILEGQLVYHKKVKARAARIQIRAVIRNDEFLRKLETVKWIAEAREQGVKQVYYKLSLDRPLLIVGKQKYLNPLQIGTIMRKRLGLSTMKRPYRTLIMGYGKGEYSLELVLDLPLRKDKISRTIFQPEPTRHTANP